jgi:hypothetical protein
MWFILAGMNHLDAIRKLAILVATALAAAIAPTLAQPASQVDEDRIFDKLANTLIVQIDKAIAPQMVGSKKIDQAMAWLNKSYKTLKNEKPRIAIWPFDKSKIRISQAIAAEFNAKLRSRMITHAGGRYEFIAPDAMADAFQNLRNSGVLGDKDENAVAALFETNLKADILVRGNLRKSGRHLVISYVAVKITGELAAETEPVKVRLLEDDILDVLPLDAAIDQAAKRFRNLAHDMTELRVAGISFEATGMKPAASVYFERLLSDAIANAFANQITGGKLVVKPLEVAKLITRGMKISPRVLRDDAFAGNPSSYVMKGDYWVSEKSLELRVNLANGNGQTVSWKGKVALEDLPDIDIYPKNRPAGMAQSGFNGLGPLSLQLTSDRGKNPRYKIGEKMHLKIRLDREAWLYCFYQQADGGMIQMLPNKFFWKKFSTPKFKGGILHTIPGEDTFPFNFDISAPTGSEMVKCFATSRDVTSELPTGLRGQSFDNIGTRTQRRLSRIFRQIPGAAVSETSLSVTVVEDR